MAATDQRKFVGIELLRFLCAFSIVVLHNRNFVADNIAISEMISITIDFPLYQFFYRYIRQSVELFWVISGFVLFWKYSDAFYEKRVSFKEFAIIRLSRLYPLHILTLFLVIVLQLIYHHFHNYYYFYNENFDLYHFFLNIFLMSYWGFEHGQSFNQVIWSVSVENIACIIFFLVAFKVRLSFIRLLCIVASMFLLIYLEIFMFRIMKCILLFFLGGVLFQIYSKIDKLEIKIQKLIGWFALFVALMLVVAYQSRLGLYFRLREHFYQLLFMKYFILIPAILFSFSLLVNPAANSFSSKAIQLLGKPAYATYLIHFPMQILFVMISDSFNIPRSSYNEMPLFLTYLLCVYSSSYVLHYTFEMPAMRYFRSSFLGKKIDKAPQDKVVQNS